MIVKFTQQSSYTWEPKIKNKAFKGTKNNKYASFIKEHYQAHFENETSEFYKSPSNM